MDLYLKARKLAQERAQQIIDGIKPDEYFVENDECKETIYLLSDPEQRTILLKKFDQNEKQKAVASLRSYIRWKRRRRIIRNSSKIAAILVLVIGIAITFYSPSPTNLQTREPDGYLTPGKPQATLILANGQEIKLDRELELKEKNTAILNKKSGEVVYTPDSGNVEIQQYNNIKVPRYGEYSVVLSDGSRIKLNSESELRYPVVFTGEQREVYLKGEAYMEISKDQKPFIVHAYDTRIKVYGTSFDVNSYNPDEIRIVLVQGKVGIHHSKMQEVILYPNQLARVSEKEGIVVKENINVNYYIAWQEGYFAFEEERLEDIMTTLSRWYRMKVIFENPQLKDIRFTASVQKEENISKLLNQFELTRTVSFNIIENQIFIK